MKGESGGRVCRQQFAYSFIRHRLDANYELGIGIEEIFLLGIHWASCILLMVFIKCDVFNHYFFKSFLHLLFPRLWAPHLCIY